MALKGFFGSMTHKHMASGEGEAQYAPVEDR